MFMWFWTISSLGAPVYSKFYLAFFTTGTGKTVQQYKKGRDCLKNRCLNGFNDIKKTLQAQNKDSLQVSLWSETYANVL